MNEKRIKSLVEILKTTIKELEDEMGTTPFTFTPEDSLSRDVDYSDVLTYYAADYYGNH